MNVKILCQICSMVCRSFSFSFISVLTRLTDSNGGNLSKVIFIYYKQPLIFFFCVCYFAASYSEVQVSDINSWIGYPDIFVAFLSKSMGRQPNMI
jgi:hypothetical protein